MDNAEELAQERRARLAAERLLDLKQSELAAANSKLSLHAIKLSEEIIHKREEVASVRGRSQRAEAEARLAHRAADIAERRLWDSVETIEDGFAVFDGAHRLVAANSAWLRVFDGIEAVRPGIDYAEVLRIAAEEGVVDTAGLDRAAWQAAMLERWLSERPEPATIALWNRTYVRLVDRRSRTGDTVSLGLDITDAIRRENALEEARHRAEDASRAKSAFLARMSHELRTPMNGVVGMADLLAETHLDQEQTLFVQTIKSSGEALLSLINDVLDFSKIEAGRMVMHNGPFDLEACIGEVMTLFRPAVAGKGVELALDYDLFLPTRFVGDEGRIRQVLTNLIGNAVKFTARGHVLIRIVGHDIEQDEGAPPLLRVHVSIEDSGIGIPPDMIEHIFGEFNQVESEKNRRFEGTGLGLAITRQLVELMGGRIWVDSEPGRGSVFGFQLDLPADGQTQDVEPVPAWLKTALVIGRSQGAGGIVAGQLAALGVATECFDRIGSSPDPQTDLVVLDADAQDTAESLGRLRAAGVLAPALVLHSGTAPVLGAEHGQVLCLAAQMTRSTVLAAIGMLAPAAKAAQETAQNPVIDTVSDAPAAVPDGSGDRAATGGPTAAPRLMRILAAEDNQTNRLVFSKLVGRLNIELVFATDGHEAVAEWSRMRPDLVFMDISMPNMDGKEATIEIRRQEAEQGLARTPIVALTAHAMSGDDKAILAAGLDHHLTKPLRKAEIFARIADHAPGDVAPVFEAPALDAPVFDAPAQDMPTLAAADFVDEAPVSLKAFN